MSSEERSDARRAEAVRDAVAREVHELGIAVVVVGSSRHAVLTGAVATDARRCRIGTIAERNLPGFQVRNCIVVAAMEAPGREDLC